MERLGLVHFKAEGRDPEGKWPAEESLCVFDASPEVANEWMRRFEQNAVVMIKAGQPAVLAFHQGIAKNLT